MKKLLLFFLLLFSIHSFSQDYLQNIRFRHLTTEDGLPSNEVKCILQDKAGFMWFGTTAGLVRYDGYSFKTFTDTSVSSDPSIFCMIIDDEGSIWTGSRRNGLSVYNPKTEKFRHYKSEKNDSTTLNFNDVTSLCKDNDGDIWIGTRAGLNKYDRNGDKFIQYHKQPNAPGTLFDLYVDKNNLLWCSSHYNGLCSFDKKKQAYRNYQIPDVFRKRDQGVYAIMSVRENVSGDFIVGTRGGLMFFNPEKEEFSTHFVYDKNDFNSLSGNDMFLSKTLIDGKNTLWIGTWKDGLNIYNSEKNNFIRFRHDINNPFAIISNNIRCIFEDKSGFIWIGTDEGISIYNPLASAFTVHQAITNQEGTLSSNSITAIFEDSQNRLWVGTRNAGLNYFNKEKNKFINYRNNPSDKNSLASDVISSIAEDNAGIIWLMNEFGSQKSAYNPSKNKFSNLSAELYPKITCGAEWDNVVYRDSKGLMWIGGHGAHAIDKSGKSVCFDSDLPDSLKKNLRYISVICEDKNKNIWFGSFTSGLSVFSFSTNNFEFYKSDTDDKHSLSHNTIQTIFEDKKGNIWIGTFYGLNIFIPSEKKFRRYFQKDGLPDNNISSILEDSENNLWISTGKGLCKFNPEKNSFFTYDVSDGLPSNEFTGAACKTEDGKIYFGTSNGLISFYPEQIKNNSHMPEIVLTKFLVLNKPWELPQNIAFTKDITLSYREYFFTLEFAALDYSAPEKNQYAYKLEGFNKEWVNLGNKREVTFTNLDAGDYVLKVKASNNHGLWSEEKEMLKITITPPWWKTKTFYASCIIALILMIYGYIKWREKKLIMEKKILEEKVDLRTRELRKEKERSEELLLNILPSETAEELKRYGKTTPKNYDTVTVLFTDFKGFTTIAEKMNAEELVAELDFCFKNFDQIIAKYPIEKIKTIGDAYMCAGGLPVPNETNPVDVVRAGLDIQQFMQNYKAERSKEGKPFFEIRIGIHSGPIVAGIVGIKKFAYDIWGDTVNTASRMESSGEAGKVNISGATYLHVKAHSEFQFKFRGKVAAKNKGEIDMYFVEKNV